VGAICAVLLEAGPSYQGELNTRRSIGRRLPGSADDVGVRHGCDGRGRQDKIEGTLSGEVEPWLAERDRAVERWRALVGAGLLSLEEFENRLNAAYSVESPQALAELLTRFPVPSAKTRDRRPRRGLYLPLAAAVAVLILAVLIISRLDAQAPKSLTKTVLSTAPTAVPPVSGLAQALEIAVVPPGLFARHDPADQCGPFPNASGMDGFNCYLVVRFTNIGRSAVEFIPAELKMVDYWGNAYFPGSTLPPCYNTIDAYAPLRLPGGGQATVQLCYAGIMTGGLPARLQGALLLTGLSFAVPMSAVKSSWGTST